MIVQGADERRHLQLPADFGERVGDPGRPGRSCKRRRDRGTPRHTGNGGSGSRSYRSAGGVRAGHPDDEGHQEPARDRHAERTGPCLGLRLVAVAVAKESGQDRPVRLAFQALKAVVEQAAKRECRRGSLDERLVARPRCLAPEHDQPAPVLTARADDGHQPPGGRVVAGSPGQPRRPRPAGKPGEQAGRVCSERRAGEDLVREVLQDDRAARQRGGLCHDLVRGRAGYRKLGKDLMEPLGGAELCKLGVDDAGMDGFSDRDELRLPLEDDEGQLMVGGSGDERGRQAARVARTELDRQAADAH